MKALADQLVAAIAAYDDHSRAIRRLWNIKLLATALDRGSPIVADLSENDDSPAAAALEQAVQDVEAALTPDNAPYLVTRLLECFPSSVARPAGGWVDSWDEVSA